MSNIKLRSFESKILYMNGMYTLPVAPYPQVDAAVQWQCKQDNEKHTDRDALLIRLDKLRTILLDEVNESGDIMSKLRNGEYAEALDFLTEMADLMGDIQVYCASENARFGIPNGEILDIIMDSNFSKLGADGLPIIKDGKFEKGPFYWKPEPKIRELLAARIKEYTQPTN